MGVPNSQRRATYDRLSRWYDLLAGSSERRCMNIGLQKLAVQEGEVVLEIGFGTGHGLVALARCVGDSGRVYGIDISTGMCGVAQARIVSAGLSERVVLRCGDAANLPFAADSIDAIFMSFTLELFDTRETPVVLSECRRVLRRGGRVAVVALSKTGHPGVMIRLYEWAHRRFPTLVDCQPILVQEALRQAGLDVVDALQTSMWSLPVEIVLAVKKAMK
ncbi:MAG: methyltransferase domain-containing protein [Chloroflexi bacterium]|nr:methyltransferase domain-containing protein [Chloroflexota bacterium]